STMLPAFEAPGWVLRAIIITLAVGFIPTLIFSWTFELTPQGLRREEEVRPNESITRRTGRKIVGVTIALAVLAIGLFIFQRFGSRLTNVSNTTANASLIPDKSIAVLPFDNLSQDPNNAYFSEGIQDEILTRLAKVGELKVIARTSTQRFKSAPDD